MVWESIALIGIGLVFLCIAAPTLFKMCTWKRVKAQCVSVEERNQTAALTPSGYRSELTFEWNGAACSAFEFSAPNYPSLVVGRTYTIWVNPKNTSQTMGPRNVNQVATSIAGVIISIILAVLMTLWR